MKALILILSLGVNFYSNASSVEEQYMRLKNAHAMKGSAEKGRKVIKNMNLMQNKIVESFYLKDKKDNADLLVFLTNFKNKKNLHLSLIAGEALESEVSNSNITESWLYWVAFMIRQSFLQNGEKIKFSVAAYQLRKYLGWKRKRVDKIIKLIANSKKKDIEAIGIDYRTFCNYILDEIKRIKNGYYLNKYKYSYSKKLKTLDSKILSENILIDKYIKFADATGKAKYEAYCDFSNAVEDSFRYKNEKSLNLIIEFLNGIKQKETYVFDIVLSSLKRERYNINMAYIYWMCFAIRDCELINFEIDKKTTIGDAVKIIVLLCRANKNDVNNIVSYLDKHKTELEKTLPEINIDYEALKKALIKRSKEKFYC